MKKEEQADLIAFGHPFIANPVLTMERPRADAPLAELDPTTLYGGSAKGCIDHPTLADASVE